MRASPIILTLFALLEFLALSPIAQSRQNDSETSSAAQSSTEKATQAVQQHNSSSTGTENNNFQPENTSNQVSIWLERINAFSTAIIAFLAIVTAIYIGRQVSDARTTNRAWIIVAPIDWAPKLGYTLDPSDPKDEDFGKDINNVVAFSFKNTGETPATLVESALVYSHVSSLDGIPKVPEYGPKGSDNDLLLVKGDSIQAIAFLQPSPLLTKAQVIAVRQRKAFLYAYGVVSYKDAFGVIHETQFGYLYHFPLGGDPRPERFMRGGGLPSAYNRAT